MPVISHTHSLLSEIMKTLKKTVRFSDPAWAAGAFTLIELLIVVAIIAILAAIAVPNFLEAQVRSKVSAARADMRSLVTAIEAYAADQNRYPLYGVLNMDGSMQDPHLSPAGAPAHKFLNNRATTPIAYITSLPLDPFIKGQAPPRPDWAHFWPRYFYTNFDQFSQAMGPSPPPVIALKKAAYGSWILSGAGPDRDRLDLNRDLPYDPTNGTISDGDLIRSPLFHR